MILSVSRRTDVPACFSDWFFRRIQDGQACVRNPVNPHQVSRISLSPEVVDCIVFWSKNPRPMLNRLKELESYPYYFQFTLNTYGKDMEPFLPSLKERIQTFHRLAASIGKERVLWRYDPICITKTYSVSWHIRAFSALARELSSSTETCTISFLDMYPGIAKTMERSGIRTPDERERRILARELAVTARSFGLSICACAEDMDLSAFGIEPARCIDDRLISRLFGTIKVKKDRNQRPACGCVSSIDLGAYHTCPNGCLYCYACRSKSRREGLPPACDPSSPLLCSCITEADRIADRAMKRLRFAQDAPAAP